MPRLHPPEFRRRGVELANQRDCNGNRVLPVAMIARDLGIRESCLRRWMDQGAVDAGEREGLTSVERKELVELRRRSRVLETEVEILERAAAYFAKENVLPNGLRLHLPALRRPARRDVLSGDGGVDVRVLCVAGLPGE